MKPLLPAWCENAVFYEVYPQTFYDSNGDGIGDLEGVIRKLDYIADLGATAIWLNPFYLSPMRDAGYDISDYRQVAPRYGCNADAARLFAEAKKKGLRVILDLVPGHTSIDHPWFQESSKQTPAPPFKNWYIWTESAWDNGGVPWNQKMIHGYSSRNGNFLVNFFWSQPALNFGFANPEADKPWQLPTSHPDVQALWEEFRSILRFWLEMGASGFRVDMADSFIRNDPDHREIRRFWKETREVLEPSFPDLFLIAEGHPSNLLDGSGFHSAFFHWAEGYWGVFRRGQNRSQTGELFETAAFFSLSGDGDFRPYLETWQKEFEATREGGVITVPLGNHDLPRVADGRSDEELEMAFAFQISWPGFPFIYYGEEIGLRQQSETNPIFEGHYPTRNGARTPMQWDSSENFGFSSCLPHQLYLPVDPCASAPSVAAQQNLPHSLLNKYKQLIRIHKEQPSFAASSGIEIISDGGDSRPLAFLRGGGENKILCVFSPGKFPATCTLPETLRSSCLSLFSSGGAHLPERNQEGDLFFPGFSWAFFSVKKN